MSNASHLVYVDTALRGYDIGVRSRTRARSEARVHAIRRQSLTYGLYSPTSRLTAGYGYYGCLSSALRRRTLAERRA